MQKSIQITAPTRKRLTNQKVVSSTSPGAQVETGKQSKGTTGHSLKPSWLLGTGFPWVSVWDPWGIHRHRFWFAYVGHRAIEPPQPNGLFAYSLNTRKCQVLIAPGKPCLTLPESSLLSCLEFLAGVLAIQAYRIIVEYSLAWRVPIDTLRKPRKLLGKTLAKERGRI